MGTHVRVLSESYPVNANMTGLIWFSKKRVLLLWMKVASALEGLTNFYNSLMLGIPQEIVHWTACKIFTKIEGLF